MKRWSRDLNPHLSHLKAKFCPPLWIYIVDMCACVCVCVRVLASVCTTWTLIVTSTLQSRAFQSFPGLPFLGKSKTLEWAPSGAHPGLAFSGTCAICPPALSQQLLWGLAFLYQSQCLSGWQAVGSQALGPGDEERGVWTVRGQGWY